MDWPSYAAGFGSCVALVVVIAAIIAVYAAWAIAVAEEAEEIASGEGPEAAGDVIHVPVAARARASVVQLHRAENSRG